MRYLFINQYYAPDFAATAQQLSDLCQHLVEEGHEVHVLASRSLYDGRKIELPAYEVLDGVHVHRVRLARGCRARFRDRLVDYLSFYLKAFWKANVLPRADVVVTLTTPPMISLLGTWLRTVKRTRFVYWVMDIYPDIASKAGLLRRFGLTAGMWSLIGRMSYLTANRVVVLGEDMKRTLMRKGVPESRLAVIQSWSCGESMMPVPTGTNGFRADHVRPGRFTLMYSGNMGTCHCFEAVTAAMEQLGEDGPVDLLFVGSGKKEGELRDALGAHENVRFLPYQDRSDLAESLGAADAHLITLDPRFDGLLVPSKLYGIMAAGKPVVFVGGEHNEIARIISEARCGIRVDPERPEELVAVLRQLASEPDNASEMGARGREHFLRWFDRRDSCRRFARLLEREARLPGFRGQRRPASGVAMTPVAAKGVAQERDSSA